MSILSVLPWAIAGWSPSDISASSSPIPLRSDAIAPHAALTSDAVLAEINRLRQNPSAYADWLATTRAYYDGTILRWPNQPPIQTVEGVAAVEEAIAILRQTPALAPLEESSGLSQAAADHGQDLVQSRRFSSRGSDGSTTEDRVRQYGDYEGNLTEIMSQSLASPDAVVAALMISDGDRRRTHQQRLLQADFRHAGIHCLPNGSISLCVTTLVTRYHDRNRAIASITPFTEALTRERLTALAADIAAETNQLRQDPAAYAAKLEALHPYYEGNLVRLPGQPIVEVTEGVSALEEAIDALKAADPVPTLSVFSPLVQSATDHAQDIGPSGTIGHYGSDGSPPLQRAERHHAFPPGSLVGETISFGPPTSAEWHVIQLIIDDGVPDRGHRQAMLNEEYRFTGVACEPHAIFRIVCVSTYASDRSVE